MSEALQLVFLNSNQELTLFSLMKVPFIAPSRLLYDQLINKIKQNNSSYLINACFLEMLQFMSDKNARMTYLYEAILDLNEPYIINIVNQHIHVNGLSKIFHVKDKQYEYVIPEYPFEESVIEKVVVNLFPIWLQRREYEDSVLLKKMSLMMNNKNSVEPVTIEHDILISDKEGCLKITFSTLTLSNSKGKIIQINLNTISAYTWQEMENPNIKIKTGTRSEAALKLNEVDLNEDTAFANCKSLCLLIQGKMYSFFPILPSEIKKIDTILQQLIEKKPFDHLQFISLSLFEKFGILKKSLGIKSNLHNNHSKLLVSQKQILNCLHKVLEDKPNQSQYLLVLLEYSCGCELQVLKEAINALRHYWTITYTEQRQLNILNCLARVLSALSQSPKSSVALVKDWLIQIEDTLSPYQQYLLY